MYLAKDRGKSGVAVYDEVAHHDVVTRMTVRTELQQAIPDNQFVLYFQPTVDLLSERIVGFEALVRWQHPERGLVVPDEFIPVAEQSGLIVPLGSWILAEACRATAAMPTGRGAPYVSVNVAAKQLEQPDFVDEVTGVLSSTGLGPERLVIEITESDVLADLDRIAPQLEQLRGRGIRIAVDDFGTGYSSLAYLSRLPVDVLKIDKVFVDKLMTSRQDASLARAIIELAQAMDFTTVAEGVEDLTQAEWLAAAACTYGQGYLWSRPVPFEQATRLLEAVESSAAAPVRAEAVPATRHRVATGSRARTCAARVSAPSGSRRRPRTRRRRPWRPSRAASRTGRTAGPEPRVGAAPAAAVVRDERRPGECRARRTR
jgi:EAL domain-containing protein (putative c-di-GMP-specific phosphodiesterase class I)